MTDTVWREFLSIAKEEAGSRVVETWLKAVVLHAWDAEKRVLYLKAPNPFVSDWIKKHYINLIRVHVGRILHVEQPKVLFVEDEAEHLNAVSATDVAVVPAQKIISRTNVAHQRWGRTGNLNNGYLFDNFIVGPNSSLAYAAAHAVAECPGTLYNPLFIYGKSGLGKTHLLHAIGNKIQANHKKATVLYQTTDRFVGEFIHAIRFNKHDLFRAKYSKVDVLLIDDVQFICDKDQTQEAFFHIFNALYELNKQIVVSSDTYPQHMDGIADRLRSRFAWGLVTDIHEPSVETKIAIIKKKAELNNGGIISDEIADFIATYTTGSIRELEGALVRVMAFAMLTKQSLSMDLVKRVLLREKPAPEKIVDVNAIVRAITKRFDCTLNDIRSKNRNKDIAFARHLIIFFMKKLTDKSLRDIGSFVGGRDHSTVMYGLQKIEEQTATDVSCKQLVESLKEEIVA